MNKNFKWETFDWQDGNCSWTLEEFDNIFNSNSNSIQENNSETENVNQNADVNNKQNNSLTKSLLIALSYLAAVLIISFLLANSIWNFAGDVLALNKPQKEIAVTVSDTDTLHDVSQQLKDDELIQYQWLFELFANFTGKSDRITAGSYLLNTQMDYSALLTNMSASSKARETVKITIPEGYTVEKIFDLLETESVCSKSDLLDAANNSSFDYNFISNNRNGIYALEGYLFPDTYEFYKNSSAEIVINRMLENFSSKISDENIRKLSANSNYSLDDIVIIASIIEKETTGDDRQDISSVIYNRLQNSDYESINGYLQMDSTVQYILNSNKTHLSNDDIAIDSPYNTYKIKGLPDGAICNPGLSSIMAALQPNDTDYYYFMLGDDGSDHFFADKNSFVNFKNSQKQD